jgi:uncharacterized membrane protein/Tfp pilus assembly protein PilF
VTDGASTNTKALAPADAPPAAGIRPAGLLRPEWVYLLLALTFGVALLVFTPPFQVPDEEAHFRRSVELSEGRLIARKEGDFTGDDLPAGVEALYARFAPLRGHPEEKTSAADIRDAAAVDRGSGDREFVAFSNTAIHPPLTYLPQALGVWLAGLFSPSLLAGLYAGRLLNLLAATALTFLAVRRTPVCKWAFAALALTPMTLFLSASLSSDATTNALAFLLVAQVAACALGPEKRLSRRSLAVTAVLGAAVGLAKQAYFVLPLSYLLIPVAKLGSRWRYRAGLALVMGSTLLPATAWSLVVREIYSPPDAKLGMNPREQLAKMRANPGEFVHVLYRTAWHAPIFGEEYLGFLGYLDTRLPGWLHLTELAVLVVAFVSSGDPGRLVRGWQALLAAGLALLNGLAVLVIIHLTWDKVGSPDISVQGRHLIPLGPLVAFAAAWPGARLPDAVRRAYRYVPAATAVAIPVVLSAALLQLHNRFFVDSDADRAARLCQRGQTLLQQGGREDEARALLDEALAIDPGQPAAHYFTGILLRNSRPREAAEHFRATLRRQPDDVLTLNHLAGLLADQAEYSEAIRLYQEALRLQPGSENLKKNLDQAVNAQKGMAEAMRQFTLALQTLARPLLEERYAGTARAGLYLKPNRGPVTGPDGQRSPLRLNFLWKCPPPSGDEIRLIGPGGTAAGEGGGAPFYACSADPIASKRVFVFPPPVNAALLADDEVSWFFQVPLAELNEEQRRREDDFRKERGLIFPRGRLSEP